MSRSRPTDYSARRRKGSRGGSDKKDHRDGPSEKAATVRSAQSWPAGPARPVVEQVVREALQGLKLGELEVLLVERINVVLSMALLTELSEGRDNDGTSGPANLAGAVESETPLGPEETELKVATIADELCAYQVSPFISLTPECYHITRKQVLELSKLRGSPQLVVKLAKDVARSFMRALEEKVVEATISLRLWLQVLGFEPSSTCEPWWHRWVKKCWLDFLAGRYEDRMKYLTAYLQAQHADEYEDLEARFPPRPSFMPESDIHFLGGSAYVWFSSRITRGVAIEGPDRRLEFIQALSSLKKRQPEIPNYKLKKATKDWIKKIFQTGPVQPPPDEDQFLYSALSAVVEEIVYKIKPALLENPNLPAPSTKARYNWSRTVGGAYGAYIDMLDKHADDPGGWADIRHRDYDDEFPASNIEEIVASGWRQQCVPVWSVTWSRDDSPVAALQSYFPLVGLATLCGGVGKLMVRPQSLPEPFKVRMISAGPAMSSMTRQAIQKVLHGSLQLLPEFRLTRERNDWRISEIVTAAFGQKPLALDEGYVSGDYTASTDNLSSRVSELIGRQLGAAMGMDDAMIDHFIRSLTGHSMLSTDTNGLGDLEQMSGQLMGSETSFPVLCIANLACSIVALRVEHYATHRVLGPHGKKPWQELPLKDRLNLRWFPGRSGLVINGDDFAARMTKGQYASWRRIMPFFGLAPSQGKNFFSREFVQLNSRMLVPKRVETLDVLYDTMKSLSRIELAQVLGRIGPRKVGQEVSGIWEMRLVPSHSLQVLAPPRAVSFAEACLSLPEWQQTFLDEARGERRAQLNTLFIRQWRTYLDMLPSEHMNWFVPRDLGGFGLETTRPLEMSVRHAHIAAYLRDATTPEGWRDAKLRWSDTQAATTTYRDSVSVLRELEAKGLIAWGKVTKLEPERILDSSVLNDALAWSGYSRTLRPLEEGDVQPYISMFGHYGVLRSGPRRQPPSEPDTVSWFGRTLKRLKKAAKATGRSMSAHDVSLHKPDSWDWFLPEGTSVEVTRPSVSVSTGGVALNSVTPVPLGELTPSDVHVTSMPGETPFLLWTFDQPKMRSIEQDDRSFASQIMLYRTGRTTPR